MGFEAYSARKQLKEDYSRNIRKKEKRGDAIILVLLRYISVKKKK